MTKYITMSGRRFEARSPQEAVTILHQEAFEKQPTDQDFMVAMAHRIKLQNGKTVRTDSAEAFVADLIAAEMIAEEV